MRLVQETVELQPVAAADEASEREIRALTHKTIKRVTNDLLDFQFNTMVAALIEFSSGLADLRKAGAGRTPAWQEAIDSLVLLMAPSTPYVAEEMWELLGYDYSVHRQEWPVFDEALTVDDAVEIVIQINGKVRDRIGISATMSDDAVKDLAMASPKVVEALGGGSPLKVIYVPGKLVNIVVRGS